MISSADVTDIFGNLREIYDLHAQLKKDLEPIVAEWMPQSQVAHIFKAMVSRSASASDCSELWITVDGKRCDDFRTVTYLCGIVR